MAKRVSADRWLFLITMVLVFVGLVMVFSASAVMAKEHYGSGYTFLLRQMAWAMGGLTTRGRLRQPHLVSPGELKKVGVAAGEVVERPVAHERALVQALDRDLAGEHAVLVLGDQVHVGAQRVERALHLGEHRARDLGDHRQAVAAAGPATQRRLPGRVAADEVDAHRLSV